MLVGSVWLTALLPALILGPLAGAVADRFDRRMNMIVGDVVRAVLYLSIPINLNLHLVNELAWMYIALFLASCASLSGRRPRTPRSPTWSRRTGSSGERVQPVHHVRHRTRGRPVFGLLALISRVLGNTSHYFRTDQVNLALYFDVATFVVSALTIFALREIPRRRGEISSPSVAKMIVEGWRYIGQTQVVRGIVIGMVGAFAAAGVVVGLGQVYVTDTLHGGEAGWGIVFAAIFIGLALGMFVGLRVSWCGGAACSACR